MTRSYFNQEHEFAKRHAEAARIREKYPDRIPVSSYRNALNEAHIHMLVQVLDEKFNVVGVISAVHIRPSPSLLDH